MGIVLRQIDTITVEHKRQPVKNGSGVRVPASKLETVKVCTHVNTSKVYTPNGKRECARRVRQATLRAIRGELRRFKKAAA